MRIIVFLLALSFIGCATNQVKQAEPVTPAPKMVWSHEQLYEDARSGKIQWSEVDQRFLIDSETCKVQALQLPIPSPSCSTIPAPDCSGQVGFMLGACRAQTSYQKCDYSAVHAAYDAQNKIRHSCMVIKGWKWVETMENPSLSLVDRYSTSTTDRAIQEYLNLTSLNDLPERDLRRAIDSRWWLISQTQEYKDGNFEFKDKTKDEFFLKHIAPFYPPEESDDQKLFFKGITAMQDLIEIDKKISEEFGGSGQNADASNPFDQFDNQ